MRTVQSIHEEIDLLKKESIKAMMSQYPLDSTVNYFHGTVIRSARVVEHNPYSDRLLVEGKTGKRYWIEAIVCL